MMTMGGRVKNGRRGGLLCFLLICDTFTTRFAFLIRDFKEQEKGITISLTADSFFKDLGV